MLIETSKDLLFIALALCAVWLTVFISWFLYYLIALLRDAEAVARQGRRVVDNIDRLVHAAHDKMERSAASLSMIGSALKEVVVWALNERAKKKEEESESGPKKGKKKRSEE